MLLLSLLFPLFLFAKKEPAVGHGFVFNRPAQLFKEPDETTPVIATIPVGGEFELLERGKSFNEWLRVRWGRRIAYLRGDWDAEALESHILVLEELPESQTFRVTKKVSVHRKPTTGSKIVTTLPLEEAVEVVSGSIDRGQFSSGQPAWYQVKTLSKQRGYVSGDALSPNELPIGYAAIRSQRPVFLPAAKGEVAMEDTDRFYARLKTQWPPIAGQLVLIKAFKTIGQKTYFQIYDEAGHGSNVYQSPRLWIASTQVDFFLDLYEYTKTRTKSVSRGLLDFLNAETQKGASYGVLDARSVKVQKLRLTRKPESGVEFFFVKARQGISSSKFEGENGSLGFFLMKRNNRYELLDQIADNEEARFMDIDGDGQKELITTRAVGRRGELEARVYSFASGSGVRLLQNIGRLDFVKYTVEPPYIIAECLSRGYNGLVDVVPKDSRLHEVSPCFTGPPNLRPETADQWVHVLKLSGGEFTEVSLTGKYQKRDAELRAGKK